MQKSVYAVNSSMIEIPCHWSAWNIFFVTEKATAQHIKIVPRPSMSFKFLFTRSFVSAASATLVENVYSSNIDAK